MAGKSKLIYFTFGLVLLFSMAASLLTGPVHVPFRDLWHSNIIQLRLARMFLALLTGAALSVAGVIFQALLRNPLAEPYILGISSGSGLGAATAILLGLNAYTAWSMPALAFLGGVATIALVYALARTSGGVVPIHSLLLSGVIINAIFGSLLIFMASAASLENLHSVVWWLLGSLQIFDWTLLKIVGALILIGLTVTLMLTRSLNLMTLGEESAGHLGLKVEQTKLLFFGLASLLTGTTVAACGLIGFVGLLVPHFVRLWLGPDHRRLVPACILAGSTFLILADMAARTLLAPVEIPIGVVTALLGGPLLLVQLRRKSSPRRS